MIAKNHYKIKLRSVGYRLVYEAGDNEITVYMICVGQGTLFIKF